MTTKSRTTISVVRHFAASPEQLFDAWTDPTRAWTWMARAIGELVRVEVDPHVYGAVRQVIRQDGREIEHSGEYLELARPNRLTFTWSGPRSTNDGGLVRLTFVAAGSGTDVILSQERVAQGHEGRTMDTWKAILGAISVALGRSTERGA